MSRTGGYLFLLGQERDYIELVKRYSPEKLEMVVPPLLGRVFPAYVSQETGLSIQQLKKAVGKLLNPDSHLSKISEKANKTELMSGSLMGTTQVKVPKNFDEASKKFEMLTLKRKTTPFYKNHFIGKHY